MQGFWRSYKKQFIYIYKNLPQCFCFVFQYKYLHILKSKCIYLRYRCLFMVCRCVFQCFPVLAHICVCFNHTFTFKWFLSKQNSHLFVSSLNLIRMHDNRNVYWIADMISFHLILQPYSEGKIHFIITDKTQGCDKSKVKVNFHNNTRV